ncbi:hypothetical protein FHU10_5140 [Serratia fonticola]|jgi:hypothetical protein|uniref:Uncharacterized protein n=1 Tax=Serratia fonticola TaxID=47917 RepID=A0A559TD12_SERFO|nr:pyocin knob domain-containing protein [Serratia fonticola]TQI80009.1 hypothetical protein FHU09_2564 [Serratia fonticola]TQI97965.1 hypothetical protein FHU11_3482 [Serratia fonticola]TVZ72460.1 hypothetical protein FHU10_5140 [Serratia fonticola]
MSDGTKISELPLANNVTTETVVPAVSNNVTEAAKVKDILALVDAGSLVAKDANNALTHDQGLKVMVSQDEQNELFYLDPKVSDKPGLYSRPLSAMLFPIDESITKQSIYQGNPKNSGISVKISSRPGNALKLIKASESTQEQGVYVSSAGPVLLTPTTNLNTVTTAGLYIAPGGETSQDSYSMNYPLGVGPGSEIQLSVSVDSNGKITQSLLCSFMGTDPGPWVRMRNGSSWSVWTRHLDTITFKSEGVRQVNRSQNGLLVHKTNSSVSSACYYSAPDGTTSKPNPKTTPTANEGVKLGLTNPSAKPTQGVFCGVVLAVDSDGRAFTNVDRTNPGTTENPGDVNWRELVSVHIKDLVEIPDATAGTEVETLNKILAVMHNAGMIKKVDG